MKVGDLVKAKPLGALQSQDDVGLVIKVEKDFYRHNDYFQDRLTIQWMHGERTREPPPYVEIVSESQ